MTYHELYADKGAPRFPARQDYKVKINPFTHEKFYVAQSTDSVTGQQIFVKIQLQ